MTMSSEFLKIVSLQPNFVMKHLLIKLIGSLCFGGNLKKRESIIEVMLVVKAKEKFGKEH